MSELYCEYYATSIGKIANDAENKWKLWGINHKNIQKPYEYTHTHEVYTILRMYKYTHIRQDYENSYGQVYSCGG